MSLRRGSIAVLVAALCCGGAIAQPPSAPIEQAPASANGAAAAAGPAAAPSHQSTSPDTAAAAPVGSGAQAITPASPLAPAPRTASASAGSVSGMISGLVFLVVLVVGAAWLVRRAGGMPALRAGSTIRLVAALPVGPRERVVLVEVGGQQWLLGVASGSVKMLHHFEEPIATGGGDDFAGKLRQFWPQGASK